LALLPGAATLREKFQAFCASIPEARKPKPKRAKRDPKNADREQAEVPIVDPIACHATRDHSEQRRWDTVQPRKQQAAPGAEALSRRWPQKRKGPPLQVRVDQVFQASPCLGRPGIHAGALWPFTVTKTRLSFIFPRASLPLVTGARLLRPAVLARCPLWRSELRCKYG
jgi:hypothetical protein